MHALIPAFISAVLSAGDRLPDPSALLPLPEPLRPGFAAIDEEELRFWVSFLASDELEGRDTAARGYDVAARFCASVLQRYGAKPAGDGGTYFQDFDVVRSEPDPEASGIELRDGPAPEKIGLEEIAVGAWAWNEVAWDVPWTFVGRGEGAESDRASDFRDVPVADRVVLILPPGGRRDHEARAALHAGAKRIAVISDDRVKLRIGMRTHEWPAYRPERPGEQVQVVYISRAAADRLLRPRGVTVEKLRALGDGELPRFDLNAKLSLRRKETKLHGRNVVGLAEGSDPVLRGQAVAVGAHLDHVGRHGDQIFHGADDDASGSAGVLALARAFASGPRPKRSVLLVLFTGEERGFWGSQWFVEHSPVPLPSIVAEIQLDMIGRNEEHPGKVKPEDTINLAHVCGSRRRSMDLDRLIDVDNRYIGLELRRDAEMFYGSSDQVQFGERGVPVAFFFSGDHPDYHRPSDTADKINYPKMARIIRLTYAVARDLAERTEPLRPLKRT
jgi:hypothetical protein